MKFPFHTAPQWLLKSKNIYNFFTNEIPFATKRKAYESILIFTILASANFALKKFLLFI